MLANEDPRVMMDHRDHLDPPDPQDPQAHQHMHGNNQCNKFTATRDQTRTITNMTSLYLTQTQLST